MTKFYVTWDREEEMWFRDRNNLEKLHDDISEWLTKPCTPLVVDCILDCVREALGFFCVLHYGKCELVEDTDFEIKVYPADSLYDTNSWRITGLSTTGKEQVAAFVERMKLHLAATIH